MDITEEFLVLPCEGGFRIYGVRDFPSGTWVGHDAQKLRVVGPVWVKPPRTATHGGSMGAVAGSAPRGWFFRLDRAVLDFDPERRDPPLGGCPG